MSHGAPIHRRPGWTLYQYVASEALWPTLFALFGLTTVVLTQNLLGLSSLFINRGLSASTVSLIAFYQAVPTATLMFPFSVLLGCLVALGRMGSDLEILALEASGVTAARLVWPFVAYAAVMTILSAGCSLAAAPWASRSLDAVFMRVSEEKPWSQFYPGKVTRFGDWQIEAREVNARGDEMKGVLLWMPEIGQTIFAGSGLVRKVDDDTTEILLEAGQVVLSTRDDPSTMAFESATTLLPKSKILRRDATDRLQSLSLDGLARRMGKFVATENNRLSRAAVEYHQRFSMPIATLVFGVLSVPLFLLRSNFSRAAGGVLGLLCTISYYGLVQLGEGLVQNGTIHVVAAAWMPNAILAVLAGVLIIRARREGVLGQTFDRPQISKSISARFQSLLARNKSPVTRNEAREYRPRNLPLPRYIARRFLGLVFLAFAILLVAYLLIDVMERLEWFSRHHATGAEILRFYGARMVLLASRIVPMSLLVATALTVSLLAAEGELIGMRSCGIPAPRALLPVLLLAALAVPLDAALNNVLVPRANALADKLKQEEIKGGTNAQKADSQREEQRKAAVWYRSGNQVLEASYFDPTRGMASDLSIYEIGKDRLPVKRTDASSARHVGNGLWVLRDAASIEISKDRIREVEAPRFANLGESLPAEVDTMHLSVPEVAALIEEAELDGVNSMPLRVDFHVKLAQPLACIVLPALLLFFAVGGPPFPGPAQTLLLSVVVGISYILLTGVFRSLGYGGAIPAFIGGWGPAMFFASIASFFGMRLWRRL